MVVPTVDMTYNGKPVEVLMQLIEKRRELLKESTGDAVRATAITVLKSLRADTRIAPPVVQKGDYTVTDTGWVGSWKHEGGKFHRVPRVSAAKGAATVPDIFPVNLAGKAYCPGEKVHVYRISPTYPQHWKWTHARPRPTKHKDCWYVFAQSMDVAIAFAERHVSQHRKIYSGLARMTLGVAMARVSTRQQFAEPNTSRRAQAAANISTKVAASYGLAGNLSIRVEDNLNHAKLAIKSGPGGVERAMMKAANSIAGRLRKVAGAELSAELSTPFPEVKGM